MAMRFQRTRPCLAIVSWHCHLALAEWRWLIIPGRIARRKVIAMAENETEPTNNPGVAPQPKGDEGIGSEQSAPESKTSDLVMIMLRKQTAVDLLNALVIGLGQVPSPSSSEAGGVDAGGESTIGSDR